MESILVKRRDELRKKRIEKGFTQAKLANEVGVSIEQIRSLEYGRVNPSFKVMKNVCLVLDSKPEEIF